MGSKYFGEYGSSGGTAGLSSSSSSSSSRKGKKNSGSDKPKQPQRGLGVAQLEKIRLHSQLGPTYSSPSSTLHHNPYASSFTPQEDMRLQTAHSSPSSAFSYSSSPSTYGYQGHHGIMMGLPDLDRTNATYGSDSQPSSVARWHPGNAGYDNQHFVEQSMTRSFFEPSVHGSHDMRERINDLSEGSNSQDIDLELRLSL